MAIFDVMTLRLDTGDSRAVEELAARMSIPAGAVARLLVRAGLVAVRRDPAILLGADAPAAPAAPGLPADARVR